MLDKLSPRERVLALSVFAILPVFLLYSGYSWISSSLEAKSSEISRLQNINQREQTKQVVGWLAAQRRADYRSASLPSDIDVGYNKYTEWLFGLAAACNLRDPTLTRGQGAPRRKDGKIVFQTRTAVFDVQGTLEEAVQFLYRFEQKKMLHRINRLTLNPIAGSPPGKNQRIRIALNIELIGLPDSDLSREIAEGDWNRLTRPLDEYQQTIVKRNIFGPPNNAPEITSLTPPRVVKDTPISFAIQASDKDHGDELTFELISTSGSAKIEQRNPGSATAQFISPGFAEPGRYAFEVRITDNGFPPKSATRPFTITVTEPEPPALEPEVKPLPPKASITMITSLSQNARGEKEVWIYFQADDNQVVYKVGDSFELDDLTWVIRSHDFKRCTIECNGKLLTFDQGARLSNPSAEVDLSDSTTASTESNPKN